MVTGWMSRRISRDPRQRTPRKKSVLPENLERSDAEDTFEPADKPRRQGRAGIVVGGIVGGLALLGGGAYVAGYFMAGDNTPKNASVNGVNIGGLKHDEAVAKLTKELGPSYTAPITLEADGKKVAIKPADAGMTLDADATVRKAGAGKSWQPSHIWNVLRGGTELKPVVTTDEAKLKNAIAKAAPTFAAEGKNATIKLDGIKVVTTPSSPAKKLDETPAASLVANAWTKQTTVAAPLVTTEPEITTDEVEKVKKDYADPAVSGPITVKAGQQTFPVDVSTIAAATTFTTKDGTVSASTNMDKIWAEAQKSINALDMDRGKNATFGFKDGKPIIIPSVDGVGIEKANFVKAVQPAITKTGAARTVNVPVTKKPASLSTAEAQKLGVKEVTGEFTTEFPYAEYRNVNLSRVAQTINGKLVKPGETFSMNDTLGPRTTANGYVDGYVIQGSRLVKETGGGVSQSATTLYNAIFFAGLQDVEHHPHTLYFPRYPAGREATLYYGHLDLKFKNNTDYGVVIQASVKKAAPGGQGSMTIKIWSTKTWDKVTSTELKKSDYYDTEPQTSDAKNCEPQSASPGFTVNYSRQFWKGGKVVKTEPFRWQYAATPKVTCK